MKMTVKSYKLLVARFIDFLDMQDIDIRMVAGVEELLRCALCSGLNLQHVVGNFEYSSYIDDCTKYLFENVVTEQYGEVEKQALLEACLQTFHRVVLLGGYLND